MATGKITRGSALSSKPFRFMVGPQKREFTIHSALVARQSRALDALVNGGMQEAQDGYATWEHVDERTFVRFSQHAYTGDYHGAAPFLPAKHKRHGTKRTRSPSIEPSPSKTPTSTKRDILWDAFENVQCYNSGNHSLSTPRKNTNPHEEYAGVFLSHARLYVFADCYGILQLERLSFTKLHRALVAFELYDERIDDIIELLRYCYEDAAPERLRGLVVHFAACHVEKLWKSDDFQTLLEAHGELSKALVGKLLARLD